MVERDIYWAGPSYWQSKPWKHADNVMDAYVWIRTIDGSQANTLVDVTNADQRVKNLTWLLGEYVVMLHAQGLYADLEDLVQHVIHPAVNNINVTNAVETSFLLWPKPNAPISGGSGDVDLLGGLPPIAGGAPGPYGTKYVAQAIALVRISIDPALRSVYQAVQQLPTFQALSVVTGDHQLLLQLGTPDVSPQLGLQDVFNDLVTLYDVAGIIKWSSHLITSVPPT